MSGSAHPSAAARALLVEGREAHGAGRLDAARSALERLVALEPGLAEPWRRLGLIAQQQGRFEDSLEPTRRAVALEDAASDHANLANALAALGRLDEAVEAGRRSVARDAGFAAGHTNLAVAMRALGRLDEAAQSFAAAARLRPVSAATRANLGVVLTELGRTDEAVAALEAAVGLAPRWAEAAFNLANARLRRLDFAGAEADYLRALALQPDHADAMANLAASLKAQGRPDEALAAFAEAARLKPSDPRPALNHGLMLCELKRFDEAVTAFETAIGDVPGSADLHANLGHALQELAKGRNDPGVIALQDRAILANLAALALDPKALAARCNLGLALLARGRIEEAVKAFEASLEQEPGLVPSWSNLGQCLNDLKRYPEAERACLRAIELEPTLPEAWSTLGNVLVGLKRLEDAERAYRQAVELRPELAGGWCNLGVALFRQGRLDEADAAYARALDLDPGMADAHWNQALARLQRGDYARGFQQYEWRLKRAGRMRDEAQHTAPLWDGSPLDGRAILVHAEQGFGDAIQCMRFLPQVKARSGRVVLQARAPLKRLLERAPGVDAFVVDGQPAPPVACRAPLFSLPRHFVASLDDLPGPVPYLAADPDLVAAWRLRVSEAVGRGRRKVGIVWSGNVTSEVEQGRSIPLSAFAPLARGGATLVSLQKGDGLEELAGAPFPVADLGDAYAAGDFADTAAILAQLDLVATCDTAVAHLAGALGVPVWLAVTTVADWRWLERRTDSPWYPSVSIYRQRTFGDWAPVFDEMAERLEELGS